MPAGGTLKRGAHQSSASQGQALLCVQRHQGALREARCGATHFFSVGDTESFSYLLPASLPPGHYVYDIEAIDGTGKPTKLVPGVSHVVFYVK